MEVTYEVYISRIAKRSRCRSLTNLEAGVLKAHSERAELRKQLERVIEIIKESE
jgi:hypothetical protein